MRALSLAIGLVSLLATTSGCFSEETHTSTGGTGGTSSAGGTGGTAPERPDSVINALRQQKSPIADAPYQAKVVTQFRTTNDLPDLDVRSLLVVDKTLYAGTASGLAQLPDGATSFTSVSLTGTGAIVDLALTSDGRPVVARAGDVEVLTTSGGAGAVWPVAGETIAAVATRGTEIWIATDQGLSKIDGTGQTPIAAAQGFSIRDLAIAGDVVWMATATGVRRYDALQDKLLADLTAPAYLADDDVRAVTLAADGQAVLAASATGLARIRTDLSATTFSIAGLGGLPTGELTAVADAPDATIVGHAIGATAVTDTGNEHYHSERWIPAESVTAVALGADGSRWIATPKGVSRVSFASTTFADKAALLEPMDDVHWRMGGFIDDNVSYADPWDMTGKPSLSDQDNDGLWTEVHVAQWCFAYSVTGDEAYYQKARKAMDTMFLLVDVPGDSFVAKGLKKGFVARSLVRDDEGAIFDDKAGDSHWVKQDHGGHTYYWKNDTSSDEYAGHFFGIPIFYDLCAKDEAEKQAIRDRVDAVMGYVVDGGDKLIDLDGEPTTFGRWDDLASAVDGDIGACLAAGHKNCVESYGGGGWLNSIEILGHLLAAWHVTGNVRYYDEYERLAIKERYGDMVPLTPHTLTVTSPHEENHSDHELASLAYFTLLRYEPNADRRAKWGASLLDFLDHERPERNLLENAVVASAVDGADFDGAGRTFREMSTDWREWLVDNTHRVDAELDVPDRFDKPQFEAVFPYDEIRTMKWNGNPFAVSGGGSGGSVQSPWTWLLPYWMMRYSGGIVAP